ncbi:hypothetical protein SLS57_006352 [Botryosphaeria dothidea]
MNLDSQMKYEDWDDEIKIKGVYLAEVADSLCKALDACNVQIFEHTVRLSIVFRPTGPEKLKVRKRHDIFPISTGEPYKYNQPTSIAHVDTTVPWVLDMVRSLNPERADEILKHRIQCVK